MYKKRFSLDYSQLLIREESKEKNLEALIDKLKFKYF